jgi:hypothetical protein
MSKSTTSDGVNWAFDLSKWKIKDVKRWVKANQELDLEAMGETLVINATSSPEGVDLTTDGVDELTPAEWSEAVKTLNEAMAAIFRPKA